MMAVSMTSVGPFDSVDSELLAMVAGRVVLLALDPGRYFVRRSMVGCRDGHLAGPA